MKNKVLRKSAKAIISSVAFVFVYTLIYTAVLGIPSGKFYLKNENIISVEITRINTDANNVETVIITPADDEKRQNESRPFMKFQLAPNMIHMLKRTWLRGRNLEAEYIYKFNMTDGSINIFYVDSDEIGINNKIYKLHSKDDFTTFKNITDNIYF